LTEDWINGGFGLYVHWPFCAAKCPYCDFNSHVVRQIDHDAWRIAYLNELRRVGELTKGRVLNSVFFGGGTPSLMAPDTVAAILEETRRFWPWANDIEITLEANPTSVEADKFRAFQQGGVNRVSMGIQALNDVDLQQLGRMHSAQEAMQAFDIARNIFDRVSFDLIYARQGQSLKDWETELQTALALAIDHLSVYQLTIEDGTRFGDLYKRGKLKNLPNEDIASDMYDLTQEITATHGFDAYEISNHAQAGAQSRHNLIYWRYGDYAGIGPGAHGRLTIDGCKYANEAWRMPDKWLNAVGDGTGDSETQPLTAEDQAVEFLVMGMRLNEGIDMERFQSIAGQPLNQEKLDFLRSIGIVDWNDRRLWTTPSGRLVLNTVVENLVVGIE
jgi:oxygen-independent coproporphyrinogen-3 oxidase